MIHSKVLLIFLLLASNSYSQTSKQDSLKNNKELHLENYLRLGIGATHNFFDIGGGIFFPVSEKFLIGLRINGNTEIKIFKIPSETLWNIDASLRYVPFVWKKGMISVGAGLGYAGGKKRGKFIARRLFVTEEFEEIKFNSISSLTEIEIGFFPLKNIGLFISGFYNYTSERAVLGYQIGISIYRLNSR